MEIFNGINIKVLDIETTGLDPQLDSIIELGVIEYENGELVREHSRIFGGGKSSPTTLGIHGIRDDQRIGLQRFEECAENVANYLSNGILAGYNLKKFDIPFIERKLSSVGKKLENYKLIDIYSVVKRYKVASRDFKLKTLCDKYDIEHGNHRGLEDSRCTWILLTRLVQEFKITDMKELMK